MTWRLGDSLPQEKLTRWHEERNHWLHHHPEPRDDATESEYHDRFSRAIDEWLDSGGGSCALRDSATARIVAGALKHFDGIRYAMNAFVVMPNHVHALFSLLEHHRLGSVVQSWKGYTAREINKRLGKTGSLWQEDYWDRLIRNERHFVKCRDYIRENPLKAGLRPNEYIFYDSTPAAKTDTPKTNIKREWKNGIK